MTEAGATRHWASSRPSDLPHVAETREVIRSLSCRRRIATQTERRFAKRGMAPYCLQKREHPVLCIQKCTINPVSEYERLKADQ